MKRTVSVLFSVVLLFALSVPAFAYDASGVIGQYRVYTGSSWTDWADVSATGSFTIPDGVIGKAIEFSFSTAAVLPSGPFTYRSTFYVPAAFKVSQCYYTVRDYGLYASRLADYNDPDSFSAMSAYTGTAYFEFSSDMQITGIRYWFDQDYTLSGYYRIFVDGWRDDDPLVAGSITGYSYGTSTDDHIGTQRVLGWLGTHIGNLFQSLSNSLVSNLGVLSKNIGDGFLNLTSSLVGGFREFFDSNFDREDQIYEDAVNPEGQTVLDGFSSSLDGVSAFEDQSFQDVNTAMAEIDLKNQSIPSSFLSGATWIVSIFNNCLNQMGDFKVVITFPMYVGLFLFIFGRGSQVMASSVSSMRRERRDSSA